MMTERSPATQVANRAPLDRNRIVEAAVAVVDEDGMDALTMRAVARHLGAGTMSLYRHVSGREELLELVLGAMSAEIAPPAPTGAWREDLIAIATAMRTGLLKRPQLTVHLAARAGGGNAALPLLDHTLSVLRSAGFGRRGAVLAYQALVNLVAGAVVREAGSVSSPGGDDRQTADGMVASLPSDVFPGIAWAGPKIAAGGADDRFAFGLACLLDGLEAYLARRKR